MNRLLKSERFLILAAFAAIYLIWGSTYILNFWSLESLPPFLLAGSRFLVAGVLLGLFFIPRVAVVSGKQLLNASGIGILLLGIGTGAITYAIQFIDTGLAALTVAFEPLIVVVLMWMVQQKRPTWMTVMGLLLGIGGMITLVSQETIVTDQDTLFGMCIIMISLLSWAIGSVYMAQLTLPTSKGLSAAIQMIASGIFLIIASAFFGEDMLMITHSFSWRALLSWITLVIFGSIIAYSAFNYLLIKSTPDKVATTTYVNPVVALILGWGLNNEHISGQSIVAAFILLSGVFFINFGKKQFRRIKWKG